VKTKKIMTAYLVFSVLVGIGLAIWRTVLIYRYFDPYNNAYTLGAKDHLQTLGYVMLAAVLIALTASIFLYKREFEPFQLSATHYSVFASSLTGFLFGAAGLLSVIYYAADIFTKDGTAVFRILLMLSFFLLFLSAVYFIISASARHDDAKSKKAFAFFPTLFVTAYLGASYLSPSFTFSNMNDILRNVSLAALVFYFIQETRASFYGKSDPSRFVCALVSLICVITYELPNLIVTAFWEMELTYMTMFELVENGIILYLIACACAMISHIKPTEKKQA
jgi:hypothetical protein